MKDPLVNGITRATLETVGSMVDDRIGGYAQAALKLDKADPGSFAQLAVYAARIVELKDLRNDLLALAKKIEALEEQVEDDAA